MSFTFIFYCMELYWQQNNWDHTKQFWTLLTQSASQHLRVHRHGFVRAELDLCMWEDRILSVTDDLSMQEELCNYIWTSNRDSDARNNQSCSSPLTQTESQASPVQFHLEVNGHLLGLSFYFQNKSWDSQLLNILLLTEKQYIPMWKLAVLVVPYSWIRCKYVPRKCCRLQGLLCALNSWQKWGGLS